MSHIKDTTDKSVRETEIQTPVPNVASPMCPPAPMKGDLAVTTQNSQRASLTRGQALELRKSWKNLSEDIFKE